MTKTVQFIEAWEDDQGREHKAGEVATVSESLAFDLIEGSIARDHSNPGPTETKVEAPTETK